MNLKQFVEQNDFSTGASLPKGDTYISVNAEIKEIETPMNMNYRESVAWQLGYGIGFKQGYEKAQEEKNNETHT